MKRLKIIFFGSGGYTIPIVEKLRSHGLEFILTTEKEGELVKYMKVNKIPYKTTHLKDPGLVKEVAKLEPVLGVLASYGAVVPDAVIKLFPYGILNIHPSLLPKYKGPSPIQTTILSGDTYTGISVIKLDSQVDHGPIIAQERIKLKGTETTQELKRKLFEKGAEMISSIVQTIELQGSSLLSSSKGETLPAKPQDHSQETFTKKIERADGKISLENPPDRIKLGRMIRAYYPWPGVWFRYSSHIIASDQIGAKQSQLQDKIIKLLPENKIQVEGKRPMSYKEFINGYQEEGKNLIEKLFYTELATGAS